MYETSACDLEPVQSPLADCLSTGGSVLRTHACAGRGRLPPPCLRPPHFIRSSDRTREAHVAGVQVAFVDRIVLQCSANCGSLTRCGLTHTLHPLMNVHTFWRLVTPIAHVSVPPHPKYWNLEPDNCAKMKRPPESIQFSPNRPYISTRDLIMTK